MDYLKLPPGTTATLYPMSGQLVGRIADYLRIKGYLRDGWAGGSYRSAQRYFNGEPIADEGAVVRALIDAVVPPEVGAVNALTLDEPLREWLARFALDSLAHWNYLASSLNGSAFPLVKGRYAPVPFLRLAFLDLGIRWAAFQLLRDRGADVRQPEWLAPNHFRRVLDELRGNKPLDRVAERVGVSRNTLDSWRGGKSFPSDANLTTLARAVAKDDRGGAEVRLRIAVGVAACRHALRSVCGVHRIDDLVAAFERVVELSHRWFRFAPIPGEVHATTMREVVRAGASCEVGAAVCAYLAECSSMRQEVQADFLALPRAWPSRMNYWAKLIADLQTAPDRLAGHVPAELLRDTAPAVEEMVHGMKGFDFVPADDWQVFRVRGDAAMRASNRAQQAARALSTGDLSGAVEHAREAVRHEPDSSAHHFTLGAMLGRLVAVGYSAALDEALAVCRRAADLDPSHHAPPTEVGIILSNAGRNEEAEEAFASAEAVSAGWFHYHKARGINLMWLGEHSRAASCFRRSIELSPAQLDAHLHLAAALSWLGEDAELARIEREIKKRGGPSVDAKGKWREFSATPLR